MVGAEGRLRAASGRRNVSLTRSTPNKANRRCRKALQARLTKHFATWLPPLFRLIDQVSLSSLQIDRRTLYRTRVLQVPASPPARPIQGPPGLLLSLAQFFYWHMLRSQEVKQWMLASFQSGFGGWGERERERKKKEERCTIIKRERSEWKTRVNDHEKFFIQRGKV